MSRFTCSVLLSVLGGLTGFQGQLNAGPPSQLPQAQGVASGPGQNSPSLHVTVVAGRGAANVLRPASAVQPVVTVRDGNNHPVIGAIMTFSAPMDEPTVRFPNGDRTYSLVTDASGGVTIENMVPVGIGRFNIDVSVNYEDSHAGTVIAQANYATLKAATAPGNGTLGSSVAAPTNQGLSTGAKIGIVAGIVAVGAGLGIYFGTRGHKSSTSSISVGTVTVGAP